MINLHDKSLTLKQLKAIRNEVDMMIREMEAEAAVKRTLNRLIPTPKDAEGVNPSDRNRFGGGFFREKFETGTVGGTLYAKTKTGVLYKLNRDKYESHATWKKVS